MEAHNSIMLKSLLSMKASKVSSVRWITADSLSLPSEESSSCAEPEPAAIAAKRAARR